MRGAGRLPRPVPGHGWGMPTTPRAEHPVAVVAGGSRGLGLLLAGELAERGYRVAICGRDKATLTIAEELLADDGHHVRVDVCDVGDGEQVDAWISEAEGDLGPVDVAIHCAGVIQVGPVASMTPRRPDRIGVRTVRCASACRCWPIC